MEVVATLSGKFTKFVFVFLFVFAWEFVTHHRYVIQACLPLFACQQCDHWKSELIDRFFRLQPCCHNITKHVSFFQVMVFLWFWLFFLLILSTGLFEHKPDLIWVLQLYRQVFLSISACFSSHRVLLSGDFESQAFTYYPPSKHDHDLI